MGYISFGEAELDWERKKFSPPSYYDDYDDGDEEDDWFDAYKLMRERDS